MNVIVGGGGAAGLSVAASLHRRDASVTVIDGPDGDVPALLRRPADKETTP